MDVYKILKINQKIKSHRIKFLGLWFLSVLNKRYLSIQFDPVMACNFRCKMCHFTDPEIAKKLKGIINKEDLNKIASINFKNALKLQVGCAAEPTLYKDLPTIIELGQNYGIPHISLVTNGNLLTQENVVDLSNKGLNEFIISMHGVSHTTYEKFMDKGSYEKLHKTLGYISEEKSKNPKLTLRINYTFNSDNFYEIKDFFTLFGKYNVNTIQFRPIDKLGETSYSNFNLEGIENDYTKVMDAVIAEAKKHKTTVLAPTSIQRVLGTNVVNNSNDSSYLVPYATCYIGPNFFWKENFDWKNQTFSQWKNQNNWDLKILKNVFVSKNKLNKMTKNMLNYSVEIN